MLDELLISWHLFFLCVGLCVVFLEDSAFSTHGWLKSWYMCVYICLLGALALISRSLHCVTESHGHLQHLQTLSTRYDSAFLSVYLLYAIWNIRWRFPEIGNFQVFLHPFEVLQVSVRVWGHPLKYPGSCVPGQRVALGHMVRNRSRDD